MIYAVIDTNVLVSALLSRRSDAATVQVIAAISADRIRPLYNQSIISEYKEVLNRPKFCLPLHATAAILDTILSVGVPVNRVHSFEHFPDADDRVFYEVALSKENAYLVTGNIRHFPHTPIVVTPTKMLDILKREASRQ